MAGTDRRLQDRALPQPAVILVRPQMGENIGAAARAMLNFGLGEMRIVDPRDGWPNEAARAMASRADEVLDNAQVFDTTAEAIADLHQVYATTARGREMSKPVLRPSEMAAHGVGAVHAGQKVGILFGGERAGLDNDDVALARAVVQVPANPAFSSLNLAQAVLLCAYEWRQAAAEGGAGSFDEQDPPVAAAQMTAFLDFLTRELDTAGFFNLIGDKRPTMLRNLRALFHRAELRDHEVRTLFGMIRSLSGHRQGVRKPEQDGG
ncbi:MAG: RNA methyltransferase [Minwuia sp.]|uniref:RNA methyltransferase n=1 Tax=Minwuia sp. TaxID=2493630 RepID=UPI003A88E4E2